MLSTAFEQFGSWLRIARMTQRTRKLIGTIILVVFLILYLDVAAAVGNRVIANASGLVQALYYCVAGLLWVPPAILLLRWMARPDCDPG